MSSDDSLHEMSNGLQHHPSPLTDAPPGSIGVLQITDTHLYADPEQCLLGLNTLDAFTAVLRQVDEDLGKVDLILATGDLVHDATADGYARAREHLGRLGRPVYCLPGNHDSPACMAKALDGGSVRVVPSAVHGPWLFVLLDSTLAGSEGGHLAQAQLDLLDGTLAGHPHSHALVCLHHQPVPVGSAWMDTMAVDNADAFFAIIDRHPGVRGILWGHVHQTFESRRNGVRLLGSPSTCIQFAPGTDGFGVDTEPPGYRWLLLHADGTIETGVERLPALPAGIQIQSGGY
ncbi:MAG: 3',5'-cyclic-AMP phosphodiesterase [Chromatiales bacterium]